MRGSSLSVIYQLTGLGGNSSGLLSHVKVHVIDDKSLSLGSALSGEVAEAGVVVHGKEAHAGVILLGGSLCQHLSESCLLQHDRSNVVRLRSHSLLSVSK